MKKRNILILILMTVIGINSSSAKYQDGMYRGVYVDSGYQQVGIQFSLEKDIVKNIKYRVLTYKKVNFLKSEKVAKIKSQYDALLDYITGKNVDIAIRDLYKPEKIEKAGATIRATKIRSAIKDGLLHDVYAPKKK